MVNVNFRLRLSDFLSFEFAFVLFLFAGAYKSAPLFAQLDSRYDVTVLTVILGMLAGLLALRNGLRWPSDRQLVFACVYGLLVMLATGSYALVTTGDPDSLLKLQKFVVFNTYAVGAPLFLITSRERVERLLRLVLCFAVAAAAQALVSSRTSDDVRFVGVFGTEQYHALGHSAGMALLIISAALLTECRPGDRFLLAGLASVALFALFLSSARQALVGVLPAFLFLLPLARKKRLRLTSLLRFASLAAAVAVLCYALRDYVLAGVDLERVWIRMFALFDSQSSEVIAESVRPELWADGLGLWLAHPVFGVGFAGYPLWGQTGARHPHNYFVELLAELGIVGLVLGGLLAILAIRCVLQEFRRDPPWSLTAARAIWVFLFCCAMLSGDLTDNRMMFAFMALTLVSGSPERGRVTGVRTRAAAAAVAAGPVARPAALRGLPSFAAAGARESTSNATAARASSPGRTPPGLPTSRGGQRCS